MAKDFNEQNKALLNGLMDKSLESKTPGMLREELRNALINIDKLDLRNIELQHEVEMYRLAYEDLSEATGRAALEPYKTAYYNAIKNIRKRMTRKLEKNSGK